eukprot:TRINITY_DN62591_c0_g1_i3.p1 TRINITY_DN62591_c0_g1~~TRINITY_DN62591_c0_g1_i3.p1  ORF type:complete len:323 (-),score=24.26 TRINITY_DN62591_c0_g1_i3:119-1060(-)
MDVRVCLFLLVLVSACDCIQQSWIQMITSTLKNIYCSIDRPTVYSQPVLVKCPRVPRILTNIEDEIEMEDETEHTNRCPVPHSALSLAFFRKETVRLKHSITRECMHTNERTSPNALSECLQWCHTRSYCHTQRHHLKQLRSALRQNYTTGVLASLDAFLETKKTAVVCGTRAETTSVRPTNAAAGDHQPGGAESPMWRYISFALGIVYISSILCYHATNYLEQMFDENDPTTEHPEEEEPHQDELPRAKQLLAELANSLNVSIEELDVSTLCQSFKLHQQTVQQVDELEQRIRQLVMENEMLQAQIEIQASA